MGGTCAVDLTVMHPDLFSTFEDIAGDHGPTAGTRQQTIDRLYAGDAAQWAAFDPATVMHNHGPYPGVSGWFEDTAKPTAAQADPQPHPRRPHRVPRWGSVVTTTGATPTRSTPPRICAPLRRA